MSQSPPLYTIPIEQRPPHGPLFSKVFFPLLFNLGQIGINSAQFLALPLLLIPFGVGRRLFDTAVGYTKDGYGRLLILITILFGPTTFEFTTDSAPSIIGLVERDEKTGRMTKINLPDRLVIISNHQAYLDWAYLWVISCYAGHSSGMIILLKASLKNVPIIGWGMRFFKFIFLQRSWAADRENLTKALTDLGREAQATDEEPQSSLNQTSESSRLVSKASNRKRSPLWLLIFPEGTITSDEERAKSFKHAKKEGIDDFVTLLHPRSTGLLFCLRTLLPQVRDLQLLDVTIGYPGVPYGKYPQDWYDLLSVFFRSVPPPTVCIHFHLYSNLSSPTSGIPSLITKPLSADDASSKDVPADTGLASPAEARAFELWLRKLWTEKEKRMEGFFKTGRFESREGENAREIVPVAQLKWYHNLAAFGAGGMGTLAVAVAIVGVLTRR